MSNGAAARKELYKQTVTPHRNKEQDNYTHLNTLRTLGRPHQSTL
jgi:hypothetical protein